jgi:PAS domain S-box-containing protein
MVDFDNIIASFMALLLLVGAIMVYAIFKLYISLKRAEEAKQATSPVGFVVETFQGLMSQLKEKERELDELRLAAETRADITEEYNENILQSVPSGVVSMDSGWRVVKVNTAAVAILGMDADFLIGADGREALTPFMHTKPLPERVIRDECVYNTPAGKRLWLGFSLTPLRDTEDNELGHILVFTDLTELRALEAQSALRQRLSSLGEMAAGIAHELRNSMGTISGYMRLLEKKEIPEAEDTLKKVSSEVGVMDRIVSDFLSFARPGEPRLEDIELDLLAKECAEAFAPDDNSLEVRTEIEGDVHVRADEVFLRQALSNLIQNAVHASADGQEVLVKIYTDGTQAVIEVIDRGYGMDPAIRDRIFDPFFTTKDHGTGLGLAIVHRSIISLGGTVDVVSSSEGTTFTVKLPSA